jgi:hypothetical protein
VRDPDGPHWVLRASVGFPDRRRIPDVAALHANSSEARGLAEALKSLQQQPYGWALLGSRRSDFSRSERSSSSQPRTGRIEPPSPAEAVDEVQAGVRKAVR